MDYPITQNVGLGPDGKFTGGDPSTGESASRLSAAWMNAVTDEIKATILALGANPSENNSRQLSEALLGKLAELKVLASKPWWAIPGIEIGQLLSVLCEPSDSITRYPLTLQCNGAAIKIDNYRSYADFYAPLGVSGRSLTPMAVRLGLVLNNASGTITVPDFTNTPFIRSGIGSDIGRLQLDQIRSHKHTIFGGNYFAALAGGDGSIDWYSAHASYYDATYRGMDYYGGDETRPINRKLLALIKVI